MTKKNSNATTILLFLHKLCEVFIEYFKELEEESIRDNFVIIYELLDEMMDFGYPQTTESKILQEYDCLFLWLSDCKTQKERYRYITQEYYRLETHTARPPMAVTNAVSWRSEGIKYRKNEVFLDVVESVNLIVGLLFILLYPLKSDWRSKQIGECKWKRCSKWNSWSH